MAGDELDPLWLRVLYWLRWFTPLRGPWNRLDQWAREQQQRSGGDGA